MDKIEKRIKPHVEALQKAGWKTTSSCGHDMYIDLDAPASEFKKLYNDLLGLGYRDFKITYHTKTNFEPQGYYKVTFGGELRGDGKPFDLVLLQVEPDSHPLYFVLAHRKFPDHGEDNDDLDHYFFEDSTCPTNWTSNIIAVISNGDEDPHGFASFVRRRSPPEGMSRDGYYPGGSTCGYQWKPLFPEIEETQKCK